MSRMHEAQPENATFTFRCVSPNRPSVHRKLLAEAVGDCGGAGQIGAMIRFGECWSGQLDSPDRRRHLTWARHDGTAAHAKCPASHPYVVPELTQTGAYTIERSDGEIHFASDRMPGMPDLPGGSTFHADYIPAWDPPTLKAWTGHCIDKLLNCGDGVLGDGTQMKRPPLILVASPRLVPVPARPTSWRSSSPLTRLEQSPTIATCCPKSAT